MSFCKVASFIEEKTDTLKKLYSIYSAFTQKWHLCNNLQIAKHMVMKQQVSCKLVNSPKSPMQQEFKKTCISSYAPYHQ